MRRHLALRAALLLAFLLVAGDLVGKPTGVWLYTVKTGDTCWNIAERYFGDGKQYLRIHKLNQLGPMPHILKAGQRLRLPGSAPVPDATIEWLRRDVRTKPPTSPEWRRAQIKQELWRLYKVATGDGSSAGIIFEDASFLRLRESALLVIYGGSRERSRSERLKKREIVIEKGIVRGGLAALYGTKSPQGTLTLRTPSATIKLSSPSSQIEVDEKKTSILSVYRGEAKISAKGHDVKVPKEFGTRVENGKRPEKPRPLPPAPRWRFAPAERIALVPRGGKGSIEAQWLPVRRAARYRVELSRSPTFRNTMIDAVVGAGILRFRATNLAPGSYYARVAAIDKLRLEGRPSRPLAIRVVALASTPPLLPSKSRYLSAAFVRIAPPPPSTNVEISLDGGPFAAFRDALRFSKPGLYRLRFRRSGSSWPPHEILVDVRPVRARLTVTGTPLQQGREVRFQAHVVDREGRPLVLPRLRVELYPGSRRLALSFVRPGVFVARWVPDRQLSSPLVARLAWAGGDLIDETLTVTAPRPAETPRPKPRAPKPARRWSDEPTPLASEWALPAAGLRPIGARPLSFVGLTTHFGSWHDATSGERRRTLRLAFHGEIALLRQRLGLDLDLPWLALDPARNSAQRNKFGDLRLGIRGLVLRRHGLELSPYVRALFSTGDFGRPRNDNWLEPGLALDWRWRDRLLLNTNQTLAIGLNAEKRPLLTWGSTYDAIARITGWFSLGAELGLQLGLHGPDNRFVAVTASGLFRFTFSSFRIDLFGGGGLNGEARRRLGEFQVGLGLSLLFDNLR